MDGCQPDVGKGSIFRLCNRLPCISLVSCISCAAAAAIRCSFAMLRHVLYVPLVAWVLDCFDAVGSSGCCIVPLVISDGDDYCVLCEYK